MNTRIHENRAHRGFTLVELLVVIGVISLLAAIAVPVFSRVREAGRANVCSSNLKQLGLAFAQYVQDSGGRYPGSGDAYKSTSGACFASTCTGWLKGTAHWVSGPEDGFLADPAPPFAIKPGATASPEDGSLYSYVRTPKVYYCPSNKDGEAKHLSYSMNCALTLIGQPRIKQPSDIVLLVDEEGANDGFFLAISDSLASSSGTDATDALTSKHNGGGNLLFADGHVKRYGVADFPLDGTPAGKANKWRTAGTPRFHDKAFGTWGSMLPPLDGVKYVTDFCNAKAGPGNDDGTANATSGTPSSTPVPTPTP